MTKKRPYADDEDDEGSEEETTIAKKATGATTTTTLQQLGSSSSSSSSGGGNGSNSAAAVVAMGRLLEEEDEDAGEHQHYEEQEQEFEYIISGDEGRRGRRHGQRGEGEEWDIEEKHAELGDVYPFLSAPLASASASSSSSSSSSLPASALSSASTSSFTRSKIGLSGEALVTATPYIGMSRRRSQQPSAGGNNGKSDTAASRFHLGPVMPPPPLAFPYLNGTFSKQFLPDSGLMVMGGVDENNALILASQSIGYRSSRVTRGVFEGTWVFDIKILPPVYAATPALRGPTAASKFTDKDTFHVRVGWGSQFGDLNGPVGYDKNSYGIRDVDGEKIHRSWRETYSPDNEGFGEGDVISCFIHLPSYKSLFNGQTPTPQQQQEVQYQDTIESSWIKFAKNGKDLGVAFMNLYNPGFMEPYYPSVALYNGARVELTRYCSIEKELETATTTTTTNTSINNNSSTTSTNTNTSSTPNS